MRAIFHDEEDGNPEPTPGLPQKLPDDERILWRGRPATFTFAVQALPVRMAAIYLGVFTAWRVVNLASSGATGDAIANAIGVAAFAGLAGGALLLGIGALMARSTIYTITDRRIVIRFGVAIRKYVNIPFVAIESAGLKLHARDAGSIALTTKRNARISFMRLWPHARIRRRAAPEPILRAVPDAADVARILCDAVSANAPGAVRINSAQTKEKRPSRTMPESVAAA